MTAFMIARVNVTEPDQFKQYAERAGAATAKFGGKYLARGGDLLGLENHEDEGKRVVIIQFPTMEDAQAWYNSPEYQDAKKYRENAAFGRFMIVDGVN